MIAQGYNGVYLDLIDDPMTLVPSLMRIGKCPPLNSTASGKVLLSRLTPYELDEFVSVNGLVKNTEKTIVDKEGLVDELNRVRQQGYATEIEECSDGVECVAVPVYDFNDSVYMALCVFGNECITDPQRLHEQILPKLCSCAKEVSLRLGCSEAKLASYSF